MIFLPDHLGARLLANGQASLVHEIDHIPVIKFFDPCGAATWLLSECRPDDPESLFGLCDLGMGYPELGYVSLAELKSVKNRLGLPLERDFYFAPHYPLSIYAHAARIAERITEDEIALTQAAVALGWTPPPGFQTPPPDRGDG